MTTVSAERLAKVFVEVADTAADDFDLRAFLRVVTARAAELLDGCAVGVFLADNRGELRFMAASDEKCQVLGIYRVQRKEGPFLDAFRTGTPIVNADLAEQPNRWPAFTASAQAAGFRWVHAFPLRRHEDVIGALNVLGGGLDESDVEIVQAFSDIATIGLMHERALRRAKVLTEQLQYALDSRIVIEQAKGAVSQAHGTTLEEAFQALRRYARRHNRKLSDIAHTVLTDREALAALIRP